MTRILVIDNYDSFVYNIVQYLAQLGAKVDVKRNDEVTVEQAREYDGVLLSPGPGTPSDAGVCIDIVKELGGQVPIFGVCLGHQAIGQVYGGNVVRAPELLHGKTSPIHHFNDGVFAGLPNPMPATRYHSLIIERETLPEALNVTAQTDSGMIMGVRHHKLDVEGVQFHPESILTTSGHDMIGNFVQRVAAFAR